MPHYFFHLRTEHGLDADETGLDCASLDSAYLEAFRTARQMWRDRLMGGTAPLPRAIEIADGSGPPLLTVPLQEVIEAAAPRRAPPHGLARRRAQEQARRTVRLTAGIAEQVVAAQEALARSHELLKLGGTPRR